MRVLRWICCVVENFIKTGFPSSCRPSLRLTLTLMWQRWHDMTSANSWPLCLTCCLQFAPSPRWLKSKSQMSPQRWIIPPYYLILSISKLWRYLQHLLQIYLLLLIFKNPWVKAELTRELCRHGRVHRRNYPIQYRDPAYFKFSLEPHGWDQVGIPHFCGLRWSLLSWVTTEMVKKTEKTEEHVGQSSTVLCSNDPNLVSSKTPCKLLPGSF